MSDLDCRESLKPYLGKRITVEMRVVRFGEYHDYKLCRKVPSALVNDVEIIEENDKRWLLTSHCWLTHSVLVDESDADQGDVVRAKVSVYKYHQRDPNDHNKHVTRYGIRDPLDVEVVRKLSQRDTWRPPVIDGNYISSEPEVEEVKPLLSESKPLSDRTLLTTILDLVDVYGIERIEKVLSAVKMLKE